MQGDNANKEFLGSEFDQRVNYALVVVVLRVALVPVTLTLCNLGLSVVNKVDFGCFTPASVSLALRGLRLDGHDVCWIR